jgi:hypothetical protein
VITGNNPRYTQISDLHVAFKIPYAYDFITKVCTQQAKVIQTHENENGGNIAQGKGSWTQNIRDPRRWNYSRSRLVQLDFQARSLRHLL